MCEWLQQKEAGCSQTFPIWVLGDSGEFGVSPDHLMERPRSLCGIVPHATPTTDSLFSAWPLLKHLVIWGSKAISDTPREILPLSFDFLFTMTFWDVLPSQCLILLLCHIDFELF